MTIISNDQDTKARLLAAAKEVIAERGLQKATVRDICTLAGANVAAINYHFGGKEKLFVSVLENYLNEMERRYPYDDGVTPQSPPEDRLRAFYRSFLLQTLGDGDPVNMRLGRLLTLEFVNPSHFFAELFEKKCRPTHNYLLTILRDMLPGVSELDIVRSSSSVVSQCLIFDFSREAIVRIAPELELTASNIDSITDFMMEFALGGLDRLRPFLKCGKESGSVSPN